MPKVKLGDVAMECRDVCKSEKTKLPAVGLEHLTPGEIKLSYWSETVDNTFTKAFRKGSMLFGRRRAYLKKAALAPFDGVCSGDITVIEALPGKLLPELLPFVIQNEAFFDFAVGRSAGSLSPRVKWEHLRNYKFDIPNIDRQGVVSEILWAAENTRIAHKHLADQADKLVKSQYIDMFGGEQNGGELTRLEDCCISISGGGTPSMQHPEYYGGEIPFIKSGDVKGSTVSSGCLSLTKVAIENTNAKLLPAGCVLLVIRSAILRNELPLAISLNPLVINQDLKAFQPKPEFDEYYLYWAIKSKETDLLMKVQTMLTSHIEFTDILNLPVRIAPRSQQKQFREFVEQIEKSKFAQRQAIESISALIKSLMQQDFNN